GRPKGSRNKRTQEILDLIQARDDKEPLGALSEIVSTNKEANDRGSGLKHGLRPYLHSNDTRTSLSAGTCNDLNAIRDYLAALQVLLSAGQLDSQSALELSTLTKNWIDAPARNCS